MGTSASSKGPGGGVPLVPPWVPDAPAPNPSPDGNSPAPADGDGTPRPTAPAQPTPQQPIPAQPSPLAPAGRFGGARTNLGNYARSGDARDMRRGLRDYVKKGYGGRATAVKRFGGTASTANTLYNALSSTATGHAASPGSPLDPNLLAGKSAREVMDTVVEAVRPADGTQDAEASRAAIKDALSELLTIHPNADLLNLTEDQRGIAIEHFVGVDVYRRTVLDIGKTIQEKAQTASDGLARLKEVKDYIKQTVAASFRNLRAAGQPLTKGRINQIVRAAIDETFQVFEAYSQ